MIQFPGNPEVVVIGAGAAGIGAGLSLMRRNIPFVILEAKQRVGGRAYSESSSLGQLWDHGCHWFHSAGMNVLRALAGKIGHRYQPEQCEPAGSSFVGGTWQPPAFRDRYVWDLLAKIAAAGREGRDVAADTILDRDHVYYPLIRHWCQLLYSHDPEAVSTGDAGAYRDTHVNLAVEDGYGALVARLARDLPVRLSLPVTAVRVAGGGVKVETAQGTIAAKACIVAVPARMLETQRIAFDPGLPEAVQAAIADVPMGHSEKVAIAFDGPVLAGTGAVFADVFDPVAPGGKAVNFELHPFGRPIAVAHFGGSDARELAARGEAALCGEALAALARAFGPGIRAHVVKTAATAWSADPWIGGAYSCARPGRAHVRAVLSEPIHDRVFLAGEHVHPYFMATAHGAFETGQWAAAKAARAIGLPEVADDPLWLPA